jgi:hypothetical protein
VTPPVVLARGIARLVGAPRPDADRSRLFAALVLIAAAGVALFGASVLAARLALGRWHESELRAPD